MVCLLGCSPYQGDKYCPVCLGGLSCLWFKGLQRPNSNEFANCSQCSHKPGLVKMSAKQTLIKFNKLEKLKLIKEPKAKHLRSLASQFDVSIGAMNNILKRKREYENLGDPLG